MTMDELIALMMQQADKYATESYEDVIVGTRPARRHKKKRIQKKWIKKYGIVPIYQKKKCKIIDITPQMVIDFCFENGHPLPKELSVLM